MQESTTIKQNSLKHHQNIFNECCFIISNHEMLEAETEPLPLCYCIWPV